MRRGSVRYRLSVWYACAFSAGLLIFGLTTWFSLRYRVRVDQQQTLAAQMSKAQDFVRHEMQVRNVNLGEELDEYTHGLARGSVLRLDRGADTLFDTDPGFPYPARREIAGEAVRWQGHSYLAARAAKQMGGHDWTFSTAVATDDTERIVQQLALLLAVLLPLLMIAAGIAGTILSRRALRPIDELTEAANAISVRDLSQRLPVPATGDELERLALSWNALLARLESALERVTRFASDAAHELRTPVSVIRTAGEIATRRERPADEYRTALVQMTREAERLTELLDDLLALTRADVEAVALPMAEADLGAIVKERCEALAPLGAARGLHLQFEGQGNTVMPLNEAGVRRMVTVVLDNALQYSRENGRINISLRQTGKEVALDVEDSGPGVAEADRARLFERFYRSDFARERNPDGAGLGLSLAAAIARRHNATITIAKTAETGSTFRILFRL